MINPTDNALKRSSFKRREAMLNSIAKLIGCTALVVTVAVVFYVIVIQLDKSGPKIDPAYVEEVMQTTNSYRWSGTETVSKDVRLGVARPVLRRDDLAKTATLSTTLPGPQTPAKPTSGITNLEAKLPDIENVVRRFFNSSNVAEKAAVSRDSSRVLPLMEVYYQKHPLNGAAWQKLGWVLPMDEPDHRLAYAQALFLDGDPVCLVVEETADGSFHVDWESSVRYSELDWKEFLATRPDQPTLFRVIASKPLANTAENTDATQEVIELKHPAEQGVVYAYFNKNDPQFRSLVEQLQLGNWSNVPLTLRLCYPGPTSNARAVRIAGVEGKGWLILHKTRS